MKHKAKPFVGLLFAGIVMLLAACADVDDPLEPKASDPAWSPNGQQIVYVCFEGGETFRSEDGTRYYADKAADICVMNRDGTNKRRLVQNQVEDYGPVWSPDGKAIAFASHDGLYLIDAGGGEPQRLFERYNVDRAIWDISWSPDGLRLAFVICRRKPRSGSDIHIIDRDGQNLVSVENLDGASVRHPQWSPDGSQIAYTSAPSPYCLSIPEDSTNSVTIADVQNAFRARKIADNLPEIRQLTWIDQETLAYTSLGEGDVFTLYSVNLKSGSRTETTKVGIYHYAWAPIYAWAPDGTASAYITPSDAVVEDYSSGHITQVWAASEGRRLGHVLEWSPDSQWLLLTMSEKTHTRDDFVYAKTIWVIGRDGEFAQRLAPLMPDDSEP